MSREIGIAKEWGNDDNNGSPENIIVERINEIARYQKVNTPAPKIELRVDNTKKATTNIIEEPLKSEIVSRIDNIARYQK